ncbi:MAG: hypothetical protein JNL70_09000 [Saprospiraceae bacterium]|nr:hypothetical protein [Saprospiraceae bacterium]
MKKYTFFTITLFMVAFIACDQPAKVPKTTAQTDKTTVPFMPNTDFNSYWYAGKAELTSYDYEINRYDEPRKGYAVFVFVTEPFSKSKQVKLDDAQKVGDDNVPVLKLNALYRFNTGIYDYSMMTSLFTPVDINTYPHSLKSNTTVQDWCGHVFSQLNWVAGNKYATHQYSYFETEGDKSPDTEGVLLEDEIFTRLRINPASLSTGMVKVIPNLTYTRIRHKPIEGMNATIEIKEKDSQTKVCHLVYESKRRLEVVFEAQSPYKILAFTEFDGDKVMSKATLKKTMMSDYWAKHDNKSAFLRQELGL